MDFQKRQTYETLQIFAGYLCLLLISLYLSSHYIPTRGVTQLFEQDCVQFQSFDTNYQTFLDDLNSNNFNFNELSHEIFHDDYDQIDAYESDRHKEEKMGYDPFKFISNEPDFSWKYDSPTWLGGGDSPVFFDKQFEKREKKLKTSDYSYQYVIQDEKLEKQKLVQYVNYKGKFTDMDIISTENEFESSLKKPTKTQIQSQKSKPTQDKVKKHSIYDSKKSHKNTLSQQLKYLLSVQTDNIKFKELVKNFSKDGIQLETNQWKASKKENNLVFVDKFEKKSHHKFALSKQNTWEQHLKSLRTHFLQQLFNDFQDRLWKVPNQKLIKEYCFSDSVDKERIQSQKQQLIQFLISKKEIMTKNYEHFELKRDFYLKVIQEFIQTLELAWSLEGKIDELLYQILFRVKIKTLFE